jgi:hypothetical protein
MPKQIVTARMKKPMETRCPRKRWTDEVIEDLKITAIRNWKRTARDWNKAELPNLLGENSVPVPLFPRPISYGCLRYVCCS